ncbi:unnamed protein product, partial [Ectocarpus fasciculatus]
PSSNQHPIAFVPATHPAFNKGKITGYTRDLKRTDQHKHKCKKPHSSSKYQIQRPVPSLSPPPLSIRGICPPPHASLHGPGQRPINLPNQIPGTKNTPTLTAIRRSIQLPQRITAATRGNDSSLHEGLSPRMCYGLPQKYRAHAPNNPL